jgi:hypothetical protein
LSVYFPAEFPTNNNPLQEVKSKALIVLKLVRDLENARLRKLLQEAEEYQLALISPKNFDGSDPENYIKNLELSFELLCTSLEELGVNRPQELSTLSFYSKIDYFKKKKDRQAAKK